MSRPATWRLTVHNLSPRPDLAEAVAWHRAIEDWEDRPGFTYAVTEDSGTVTVTSTMPGFLAELMAELANSRTFDRVTLAPDTTNEEG